VEGVHLYARERGAHRQVQTRGELRKRERRAGFTEMEHALQALVEERDNLLEQLEHVRDLADRMMTVSEEGQVRIVELEKQLSAKQLLVDELELENRALLEQGMARAERLGQLEATLTMLAEAEG
jgi:hypothetical protein